MISVLSVHNLYQQPGGESVVRQAKEELLSAAGHQVVEYARDNVEIAAYDLWQKGTLT